MADDNTVAMVEQIISNATAVYDQMVAAYAAAKISAALEPGGEIYEKLMSGAISGALAWYGMYTPLVYRRGMTMSNPGNIAISGGATSSGNTISGWFSVANVSPHAVYSFGFPMRRYGKPFFRPGGDLMQDVPGSVNLDIDIPQTDVDTMFGAALEAVLS